MYTIIKWVLNVIYRAASCLIPVDHRTVAYISFPDAADNTWHLYRFQVRELAGYRLVWLVSRADSRVRDKVLSVNQGRNTVLVVKKNSLRGIWFFLRAMAVFHTHGTYFFVSAVKRKTVVNLWHGMPIKVIGALDEADDNFSLFSDFHISTSSFFSYVLAAAFRAPVNTVLPLGLPRNDVLKAAPDNRPITIAGRTLGNEPLVLWLPTFRQSRVSGKLRQDALAESFMSQWSPGFFQRLNEKARSLNTLVLVKLHPMDALNEQDSLPDMDHLVFTRASDWSGIEWDLYDVMARASGLITDVSSVLIDFLATGRPIAVVEQSADSYSRPYTYPFKWESLAPVTLVKAEKAILDFLERLAIGTSVAPEKTGDGLSLFHSVELGNACSAITSRFLEK